MNWVFNTYSSVYSTAMMQSHDATHNAAPAKERVHAKRPAILKLFGRR
jgi:hypothetical protein